MCFCRFRARHYFLLRKSRKVQSVMQSLRQNEVEEEMWIQKTMVKSMSHKGHMKTGDYSTALSKEKLSAMRSKVHDWDKANALPICKWFPKPCSTPIQKQKIGMVAEAKMYESVLGIGGSQCTIGVIFAFALGMIVNVAIDQGRFVLLSQKVSRSLSKPMSLAQFILRKLFGLLGLLRQYIEIWCEWWCLEPGFSQPLTSMKLFVCMVLGMELSVWMPPEPSVVATPELVSLAPGAFHKDWLTPNLEPKYLAGLRGRFLVSWCIFMLLPKARNVFWQTLTFVTYTYGALAYAYLARINVLFRHSHNLQATTLFVVSAIFAVPFLETNPKAGRWLRKFLFLNVLIPGYLFAGFSKLRYEGWHSNISGRWIVPIMKKTSRASYPELNKWITHAPGVFGSAPWPCMLMSWGNLVVELVLPFMATMSLTEGRRSSIVRWLFTVGAVLFHVAVFLMMGPNFLRQIVLFILASNPLQCLEKSEAPKPPMLVEQASIGDRLRGIYGIFIFAMWWRTSWCSDVDHLTGRTPWNKNHRDPFFPFSNFDMFAIPERIPTIG